MQGMVDGNSNSQPIAASRPVVIPRPRVVHVLHRLHYAGAEVLAAALSRELRGRFTFAFACLDEVGPLGLALRDEGFEVVALDRKPGVDFSVAHRLGSHVTRWRAQGPLLLHAHQYTPFFYASLSRGLRGLLLGGASGGTSGVPLIFSEHGRHYPDQRKLKRVLANKLLLTKKDRVTAVGKFVADALVRNEGIADKRIEVIYNGIDAARFAKRDDAQAVRARVRGELRIHEQTPVVLQVARLHPVKDHATALRAMALLREFYKSTSIPEHKPTLLLAGDGAERDRLVSLARELSLSVDGDHPAVRFLGVRTDVANLIAAADAFCLSSVSEGVSVTLLEAMACGQPIAATDVGGNREVLGPDDLLPAAGLLSPRSDHASLAANLRTILSDSTVRSELSLAGPRRVAQRFSQQQMHAHYARMYESMLRS
jgi:L-malate glycosyltransferase